MDAGPGSTSATTDRLKVFINYRRSDTEGYAGRVFEALRRPIGASNLFMDVDSMKPGQDFVRALDEAVAGCDVLLAMIGPTWLDVAGPDGDRRLDDPLDHVRVEIVSALSRDKIVIPLLFSGARMPPAGVLPEALEPLRTRNALVVRHERFRGDIAELVKELRRLQAIKAGPAAAATAAATAVAATAVPATAPPPGTVGTVERVVPDAPVSVTAGRPRGASTEPWSRRRRMRVAAAGVAAVAVFAVVIGMGTIFASGGAGGASATPGSAASVADIPSAQPASAPPSPTASPTMAASPLSSTPLPSASAAAPGPSGSAPEEDFRYPSPDGQLAGFVHKEPNGNFELYVERADGSSPVNVSNHPDQDLFLSWSPDSAWIAFISHRDLNYEVYRVAADGSDLTRLTNTPVDESWPAVSPDGSLILFLRDTVDNSQADLWVMSPTGTGQRVVKRTPEREGLPSWTPDGRIRFTQFTDAGTKDFVVNVDGTGLIEVP